MDDLASRHRLQKDVDRLTTLLQLSERKRFTQKVLYDKNLENLHDKLADFETVLSKERKEIQQIIQKKDQQIKVREDLAKQLQGKLDSQHCKQCGYPSSKNQFDTDWEIGIEDGKKTDNYRKLPPLSLPLPEILPNVSFSNRLTHSKSKLSPVAEESEVASSSYLRNIHADQNQDRFHAVLMASLECLQVDKHSKKNITPESENPEENVVGNPTFHNLSNLPLENQPPSRRCNLTNSRGDNTTTTSQCQPPKPSIVVDLCGDNKTKESLLDQTHRVHYETANYANYANDVALSILHFTYRNLKKTCNDEKKSSDNCNVTPSKSLQTFSDRLALGILTRMTPEIKSRDDRKIRGQALANQEEEDSSHFNFISDDVDPHVDDCNDDTNFDRSDIGNNHVETSGIAISSNLTEKPRSYSRSPTISTGDKPNYSRLSTMVVPLVDQAMTVAKSIVRRRSSTNFLAIDDTTNNATTEMLEKLNSSDTTTDINENNTENLSLHRKTLIELIDQAVEQVIPTDNCSKENEVIDCVTKLKSTSRTDGNGLIVENGIDSPCINGIADDHIASNRIENALTVDDDQNDDDETLSTTIVSESNGGDSNENKENEIGKKKKKNKKKKRKKKASDAGGNRLPETVEQTEGNHLPETIEPTGGNCLPGTLEHTEGNHFPETVEQKKGNHLPVEQTMEAEFVPNDKNGNNDENNRIGEDGVLDCSFDADDVVTSSLNNSATDLATENTADAKTLKPNDYEHDKFSLLVDESFNEMEASRGSTPDTLDGF